MSVLSHNELGAVSSKYAVDMCNISEYFIKQNIWSAFCDTYLVTRVCYFVCFYDFMFMFYDTLGLCRIANCNVCMFLL